MQNEALEKSLLRVHDWIKSVDQKISIALVLEAGVLAILMKPTYSLFMRLHPTQGWQIISLLTISIVVFGAAMLKALIALAPRLRPPRSGSSVLYFGTIAKMDAKTYSKKVKKLKSGEYEDDLISQIYISSVIAQKKHKALADSLYSMVFSLIPWSLALVLMWLRLYGN